MYIYISQPEILYNFFLKIYNKILLYYYYNSIPILFKRLNKKIKHYYYKLFFDIDSKYTVLPSTGKGRYVDVLSKGNIIELKPHAIEGLIPYTYDKLLIIPYKENQGVLVEFWKNGILSSRQLLSITQLTKHIIYASNIEQLAKRKADVIDKDIERTKEVNDHYQHNGDFNIKHTKEEKEEIQKMFSKYPEHFDITEDDITDFNKHAAQL